MLNTGGFTGLQALCAHFIESPVASPDCSTSLLPDLRSFYFQQDASRASVLELLDMLRLESFAFRHASPERPSKKHGAALMNLLTKRRLPLRELRMESIWMSDADLLRFLKVTPGLELLVIISGKTSDKIMSTLSSRQGRPARWLCPHLSRICIVSHESTKSAKFRVSKDALEELLIARWEAHDTESRHGASEVARISDVHLDNESVTVETMEEDLRWDVYRGDSPPEIEGILSSYQAHTRKHLWWMTRLQWGELS